MQLVVHDCIHIALSNESHANKVLFSQKFQCLRKVAYFSKFLEEKKYKKVFKNIHDINNYKLNTSRTTILDYMETHDKQVIYFEKFGVQRVLFS